MNKSPYIFLFLFFFNIQATVSENKTPFLIVEEQLKKEVSWLFLKKPKKEEILKKFGPPQLQEKNNFYYALDHFKYSLWLQFSSTDRLQYISYRIPESIKLAVKDFESQIKADEYLPYPNKGHDLGKNFLVLLKNEKMKLIFENNSEKKLIKIIYDEK